MARFDLLRATQGLASRVTKWSNECDVALHRLMCYIHSTVDAVLSGFIGDDPQHCKLWLFADSGHAGEHDSRSTSGCILAMVGPNTYLPPYYIFEKADGHSHELDGSGSHCR